MRFAFVFAGLLAANAATAVTAETATIIAPVFAQLVTAPLPDGFVPAYEDGNATGYLNESVLAGETVENWSQMITLTGAKGLALTTGEDAMNAQGFAEFLAESYLQACPESIEAEPLDAPEIAGAREVFAGYVSCGTISGKDMSESMVFLVLVGAEDIYTLQWAERGPASATFIAFSGDAWLNRLAQLQSAAKLCDIVPGEAAPYPSCTD